MFMAKKANIGGIHDCFKRSMPFKPSLKIENRVQKINRRIKGFQEPYKISPMWTSISPIIKHKYNLAFRSMIDEETIQDTYFSISDASGSQLKSYQNPNVISERSYYF